jgi:hypothetical protein
MKVLNFRPRNDDDPPPQPARRRRMRHDAPADPDQPSRLIVIDAFASGRTLPQAA